MLSTVYIYMSEALEIGGRIRVTGWASGLQTRQSQRTFHQTMTALTTEEETCMP